jgi:hypothetical protein
LSQLPKDDLIEIVRRKIRKILKQIARRQVGCCVATADK